jgi:methyl-accepting chemotaxis protein
MFIPSEEVDSSAYKDFWRRLSQGEAFTGVFKRINANGETVLLKAVYNPIRNAAGNVIKVVKFATVERVEVSDF